MNNASFSYSELEETLQVLCQQSSQLSLEGIGKTEAGYPLYCVVISEDASIYNLNFCRGQAKRIMEQPHSLLEGETKVPVMITASVHGHEPAGTNALLKLLEETAAKNNADIQRLLKHLILLCVVCVNPEGREQQTRYNGNGFDLNRDFIAQSQLETKALSSLITECNPLVLLDLHGYVCKDAHKLGIMEPCTPPHNPNYEYDLYEKWAVPLAESMESYVFDKRETFHSVRYKQMTGTFIPYRDSTAGWDDYAPFSTAMYALLHGTIGITIETPTRVKDGVLWLYYAIIGACEFIVSHQQELLENMIIFFHRAINGQHPHHPHHFFPHAYILPAQTDDASPLFALLRHLMHNGVRVEEAQHAFTYHKTVFPKGTFIISMHQPKAIVANTFLWKGENLSNGSAKMTDVCAWSLPFLWGTEAIPVHAPLSVQTTVVSQLRNKEKVLGEGPFMLKSRSCTSIAFIQKLLAEKEMVRCAGAEGFLIESGDKKRLAHLLEGTGLTLYGNASLKKGILLRQKKAAIIQDLGLFCKRSHAGTKAALHEMGFHVKEIHPRQLADSSSLHDVDVLIYNGYEHLFSLASKVSPRYEQAVLQSMNELAACKEAAASFIERGGRFIAIGAGAAKAAKKNLRITNVNVHTSGWNDNAILKINYFQSPLTYGFSSTDYGFVYRPVWFTNTEEGTVAAAYSNDADSFLSGYWPEYEKAQGHPVIVSEKEHRVILIGLESCHRQHTSYLYKLLANAIYA